MSVEENKDVVRPWVTARNTNDLDLALVPGMKIGTIM